MTISVSVSTQVLDIQQLSAALQTASLGKCGALVTFTGLVRDFSTLSNVDALSLEHYPGMTERAMAALAEQAKDRWAVEHVVVCHRVGEMQSGDVIVFVGIASAHRAAAFDAAQFIMDQLKTCVPLWKKERSNGQWHWTAQKDSDRSQAARWSAPSGNGD
ncbi:molybdenum cofactor biosynthesis protein MoaE [Aestuariibacter halophilus]|uniref:Molybdopterin synthase catalytic subunit n=1 Tax=Fluctibacter halophilus TaxID=226011 RepID=A0ABS8G791_9ALTE|nr:molybdenum cofactor biosynthesis protein MoaE [Aestuariibacter halophilus]MCC2615549.1 molybdenum cofactor biosynthesis protein MoaE [Aestuariibacter halophilus]